MNNTTATTPRPFTYRYMSRGMTVTVQDLSGVTHNLLIVDTFGPAGVERMTVEDGTQYGKVIDYMEWNTTYDVMSATYTKA
jgi:hypothetical protein